MKAFADDKINVIKKLKFELERVGNIVGKGENTVYQHFLIFPQCFQTPSLKLCGKDKSMTVVGKKTGSIDKT